MKEATLYDDYNLPENEPIPVGFMLIYETYEGDMDSTETRTLYGLSEEDVKFFLAIGSHFTTFSEMASEKTNSENERVILMDVSETNPPTHPALVESLEEAINNPEGSEMVREFIGTQGYGDFYRVFDRFRVFEIPQPCPRITERFKG